MRDCRDNIHYEIGMHIHWIVVRVYHSRTCLIVPDSWHGDDRNNRHSFARIALLSRLCERNSKSSFNSTFQETNDRFKIHRAFVKRKLTSKYIANVDSILGSVMKNECIFVILIYILN